MTTSSGARCNNVFKPATAESLKLGAKVFPIIPSQSHSTLVDVRRSNLVSPMRRKKSFRILSKYKLRRRSSSVSHQENAKKESLKKLGPYKLVRKTPDRASIERFAAVKGFLDARRYSTPRSTTRYGAKGNPYSLIRKRSRLSSAPDAAAVISRFKVIRNKRRSRASASGNNPKFFVSKDGRVLRRIRPSLSESFSELPERRTVRILGGTFSKHGDSFTLDRPALYKKKRVSEALSRSRRYVNKQKLNLEKRPCLYYIRYGRCSKGKACRFVHDPDKVAVCTRFLRGTCKVADCPFSHTVNKDKMPLCEFFLRGLCSRDNCAYVHVKHSERTKSCPAFLTGHCPKGQKCDKKHVFSRGAKLSRPESEKKVREMVTEEPRLAVHSVAERLKQKKMRYAEMPKICDDGEKIVVKKPRDFMDSLPEYIGFGSDSEEEQPIEKK